MFASISSKTSSGIAVLLGERRFDREHQREISHSKQSSAAASKVRRVRRKKHSIVSKPGRSDFVQGANLASIRMSKTKIAQVETDVFR